MAELEDYISFVGFLIHYVESLQLHPQSPRVTEFLLPPALSAQPSCSSLNKQGAQAMTLILGGYSYGSLITTQLPPTEGMLRRFEKVSKGSAESEIRLRANNLATQWNKSVEMYREANHAKSPGPHESVKSSPRMMAVVMGGDESDSVSQRLSHEGRRSVDAVRRSINRTRKKLGSRQQSHSSEAAEDATAEEDRVEISIAPPQTCYLLVSPLLPPISTLATMFSSLHVSTSLCCEKKLMCNPTLAIYGGNDFFTSHKKLRKWVANLQVGSASHFQFREIVGAGHFWREDDSKSQIRACLRDWLLNVINLQNGTQERECLLSGEFG